MQQTNSWSVWLWLVVSLPSICVSTAASSPTAAGVTVDGFDLEQWLVETGRLLTSNKAAAKMLEDKLCETGSSAQQLEAHTKQWKCPSVDRNAAEYFWAEAIRMRKGQSEALKSTRRSRAALRITHGAVASKMGELKCASKRMLQKRLIQMFGEEFMLGSGKPLDFMSLKNQQICDARAKLRLSLGIVSVETTTRMAADLNEAANELAQFEADLHNYVQTRCGELGFEVDSVWSECGGIRFGVDSKTVGGIRVAQNVIVKLTDESDDQLSDPMSAANTQLRNEIAQSQAAFRKLVLETQYTDELQELFDNEMGAIFVHCFKSIPNLFGVVLLHAVEFLNFWPLLNLQNILEFRAGHQLAELSPFQLECFARHSHGGKHLTAENTHLCLSIDQLPKVLSVVESGKEACALWKLLTAILFAL